MSQVLALVVKARDLHRGDVVQQCDWPLHVRKVMISRTLVTIVVSEFGFPLHYAADAKVQLVARRSEHLLRHARTLCSPVSRRGLTPRFRVPLWRRGAACRPAGLAR